MHDGITLGGRIFRALQEGTVLHDLHFRKLIAKSGLSRVTIRAGEDPDHFARRLLDELLAAGVVLEIIGCLIIPVGMSDEEWTPELASETARFVGSLRSDADKASVDQLVVSILIDFFARGYASLWTSPTPSEEEHRPDEPQTQGMSSAAIQTAAAAMGIGVLLSES